MVATISARKSVAAAATYYTHLSADQYYLKGEEVGRWRGDAANFLGLGNMRVGSQEFIRALRGEDPVSGMRLTRSANNSSRHQPGWDICLSSPKSVSVAWGLAPSKQHRELIFHAYENAVAATRSEISRDLAICRRGQGGKIRENTAGLLVAEFHHMTSRSQCPQLHTHLFVLNMAPRKDGTWGAILSKPFYTHQKSIGRTFRSALERELVKIGIPAKCRDDTIAIDGISRKLEEKFSLRRKAIILEVAKMQSAETPHSTQIANIRTRSKKVSSPLALLLPEWHSRVSSKELDQIRLVYDRMIVERLFDNDYGRDFRRIRSKDVEKNQRALRILALAAKRTLLGKALALAKVAVKALGNLIKLQRPHSRNHSISLNRKSNDRQLYDR